MGIVVQLNERRRPDKTVDAAPRDGASIHLFLGVRYERHADPVVQPVEPGRSGGGNRRPRKRA